MDKPELTAPNTYSLSFPPSSRSPTIVRNASTSMQPLSPTQANRRSPTNIIDSPLRPSMRNGKRSTQLPTSDLSPLQDKSDAQPRRRRVSTTLYGDRVNTGASLGAFSDEYNLSQEDPQLLLDVQRALKLKAKREARAKSGRASNLPKSPLSISSDSSPATSHSSRQPFPTYSSSKAGPSPPGSRLEFTTPPVTPPRVCPSREHASSLHPVPSSLDDGLTLDWGGEELDDAQERHWTLSLTKRKGKGKDSGVDPTSFEKEAGRHADKLRRMKVTLSAGTIQRAELLRNQLERRYRLVYDALESDAGPLNPAGVVRWFNACDPRLQDALDKAQPRMPNDKRRPSGYQQPWRVSASILEEYYASHRLKLGMTTIPEDTPHFRMSNPYIPDSPSLRPVIPRQQGLEDHISFEALNRSFKNSLDVQSRRSADSVYSGISGVSHLHPPPISPSPSYLRVRDFVGKGHESELLSDDAQSRRNSVSDVRLRSPRIQDGLPETNAVSRAQSEAGDEPPLTSEMTAANKPPEVADDRDENRRKPVNGSARPPPAANLQPIRRQTVQLAPNPREQSQKLPGPQIEEDEKKLRREYDRKHKLLQETTSQSIRIRQILNRISTVVRDQDSLLSDLSKRLGIPRQGLEQEILDAFGHDPAAVTSSTRRLRGWRAVEDIHERIVRQRSLLLQFLSSTHEDVLLISPSTLDDPIASLVASLSTLSGQHEELEIKAHEVSKVLKEVKSLHSEVKAEYNETLAHTSVVYPELSYIVALEESYKDHYQQVWEFGMDTLTFLLDQITPFWRTYGKTIGIDVQDFLIIPLYRNEFTGEPKRYSIQRFPRRSFRHWIGLIVFFCLSGGTCILQGRAALTSSRHFRLQAIAHSGVRWLVLPFFWIAICIQWSAFIFELCIVLVQVAVVAWWIGWFVKLFN